MTTKSADDETFKLRRHRGESWLDVYSAPKQGIAAGTVKVSTQDTSCVGGWSQRPAHTRETGVAPGRILFYCADLSVIPVQKLAYSVDSQDVAGDM